MNESFLIILRFLVYAHRHTNGTVGGQTGYGTPLCGILKFIPSTWGQFWSRLAFSLFSLVWLRAPKKHSINVACRAFTRIKYNSTLSRGYPKAKKSRILTNDAKKNTHSAGQTMVVTYAMINFRIWCRQSETHSTYDGALWASFEASSNGRFGADAYRRAMRLQKAATMINGCSVTAPSRCVML